MTKLNARLLSLPGLLTLFASEMIPPSFAIAVCPAYFILSKRSFLSREKSTLYACAVSMVIVEIVTSLASENHAKDAPTITKVTTIIKSGIAMPNTILIVSFLRAVLSIFTFSCLSYVSRLRAPIYYILINTIYRRFLFDFYNFLYVLFIRHVATRC